MSVGANQELPHADARRHGCDESTIGSTAASTVRPRAEAISPDPDLALPFETEAPDHDVTIVVNAKRMLRYDSMASSSRSAPIAACAFGRSLEPPLCRSALTYKEDVGR